MVHSLQCFSALQFHSDVDALLLASAEVVRVLATLLFAVLRVNRVVGRE